MSKHALFVLLAVTSLGVGLSFMISTLTAPDASQIEAIHARNEYCAALLAAFPWQQGCVEKCREDQRNFVCTNVTMRDGRFSYRAF
jgi:hypothetical protein